MKKKKNTISKIHDQFHPDFDVAESFITKWFPSMRENFSSTIHTCAPIFESTVWLNKCIRCTCTRSHPGSNIYIEGFRGNYKRHTLVRCYTPEGG